MSGMMQELQGVRYDAGTPRPLHAILALQPVCRPPRPTATPCTSCHPTGLLRPPDCCSAAVTPNPPPPPAPLQPYGCAVRYDVATPRCQV